MDGGDGRLTQLVLDELGDGLALESVAVCRAQVARVRRVARRIGQRRARIRGRDGGKARCRQGGDTANRLIRAGRTDERNDALVCGKLGRRRGATGRRAEGVLRRQADGVAEQFLSVRSAMGSTRAAATERHRPRQGRPESGSSGPGRHCAERVRRRGSCRPRGRAALISARPLLTANGRGRLSACTCGAESPILLL
jgi:hypothetical protein